MKEYFYDLFEAESEILELFNGFSEISRRATRDPVLSKSAQAWGDLTAASVRAMRLEPICSEAQRTDEDEALVVSLVDLMTRVSDDVCAASRRDSSVRKMVRDVFPLDRPSTLVRRVERVSGYVFRKMVRE